jgi:hypothetical protein
MTQNSDGLSIPIPISQGGTASNTAPAALAALGALPIAGGTMTGPLILNANPTLDLGAVTKQYADAISSGLSVKAAVYAASTATLNATYNNGASGVGATLTNSGAQIAFSTDGTTPALNARILIKDESTPAYNGIYVLSDQGSGVTNWILTRSTDYDAPSEISAGSFVIVNNGTLWGITSWIQTDTVTTVGTDPIAFSQFTSGVGANITLSNLSPTAINVDLEPTSDATISLGDTGFRFNNVFAVHYKTDIANGDAMILSGYNTGAANYTDFLTITANATATAVLSSGVTATTQSALTSNTTIATTAYADASSAAVASNSANKSLGNLTTTAINQSLLPATDIASDLGSSAKRWETLYAQDINTGNAGGNTLSLFAYNTNTTAFVPFVTLTAGNPPTAVLANGVTATTQSPANNTSLLATTAYVDAASALGANVALSNLSSVAINTALLPGADGTIDLGTGILRFRYLFGQAIRSGTVSGNTLVLQGYNNIGSAYYTFATITSGPTPAMALDGTVTGVTQPALTSNTTLATTAYADSASSSGANKALSNLASTAVNVSVLPGVDNTINLGAGTFRWERAYIADISAGTTAANTLTLSGYNTGATNYTPFFTITTGATSSAVIASAVTATTQTPATNNTTIATTAYSDAGTATRANLALSNLASVAINTSLLPASDATISLGSGTQRFLNGFIDNIQTGTVAANTTLLQAYNTNTAAYVTFATLTANNPPTMALASAVTAATQSALNNSTLLATTAYVDSAVAVVAGGANAALSNLASVAINTALVPGVDASIDLGTAAKRFRNAIVNTIQTGTSAGQTTLLQAYNTNTTAYVTFATLTANNPPTMALASAVTATTQSALNASTLIATTAYVDSAVTAGTPAKVDQTTTSVTMAVNTIYSANNAGLVTFTLPAVVPFGSEFTIIGHGAGGWKIAQAASQLINFGNQVTTTGTGGSLASTNAFDCIKLFCAVANTTFTAYAPQGNITVV